MMIRQCWKRFFIMGIIILVRRLLYIETLSVVPTNIDDPLSSFEMPSPRRGLPHLTGRWDQSSTSGLYIEYRSENQRSLVHRKSSTVSCPLTMVSGTPRSEKRMEIKWNIDTENPRVVMMPTSAKHIPRSYQLSRKRGYFFTGRREFAKSGGEMT